MTEKNEGSSVVEKSISEKEASRLPAIKDLPTLVRDIVLTLVLVVCVVHPAAIKNFLKNSGIKQLKAFGIEVSYDEAFENATQAANMIREKAADASAQVVVKAPTSDTEAPPPPESTNAPIDLALKNAVAVAELVAPAALPSSGWLFLGHVSAGRAGAKVWDEGGSSTTTKTDSVKVGDSLTVKTDVYLRGDSATRWHSDAPIISVAKVGDVFKVVELQYQGAKTPPGGEYVWAKAYLPTPLLPPTEH